MKNDKFYKPSWISAAVLQNPCYRNGVLQKGAIILNQVDPVLDLYPKLSDIFFIVERHGWFGVNEATRADVMLVEDLSCWDAVARQSPNSVLLDVGPSDFVDQDAFVPSPEIEATYDVIQVSCWSRRKRIELFIEAAAKMPELSFVHMGHFENNGSNEELEYKRECLEYAKNYATNIYFPYENVDDNDGLNHSKAVMNQWVNRARIGVLTTQSEGINRFKMECLAANRPCLVPNDVATPTRKHIEPSTGVFYTPTVDDLVESINGTLDRIEEFRPREYVLNVTGKANTLPKLRRALNELASKRGQVAGFDAVSWDGRNASLAWGEEAVDLIEENLAQHAHGKPQVVEAY